MTKQTFMIARTGHPKREQAFEEEFQLFGHAWVTHERIDGMGFAVSHKATGRRVPKSESVRAIEAKVKATTYLTANQDRIEAVIKKVEAMG